MEKRQQPNQSKVQTNSRKMERIDLRYSLHVEYLTRGGTSYVDSAIIHKNNEAAQAEEQINSQIPLVDQSVHGRSYIRFNVRIKVK